MYVYIKCSSTCFSICWSPIAMHMRHVFAPGKGNNPLRSAKKYVLQVILTLAHYSDIVSDIPSGSIYGIYVYIYIHTYIYILALYLTFFLAYLSHSIWHVILSGILSCIYSDIFTGIHSGNYSDIIFGILSDILSGINSDLYSGLLSGMLSGIYSDILSGIHSGILFWHSLCSGPGPAHSVWSSRYEDRRRAGIGVDEKRRRGEEGGWVAPLVKSRDPHLAGGKNNLICRSYYKCFFNRTNH